MTVTPGARFGSFEVAESLGSGGMGEVWRARDTALKRDVALKVLPQAFVDDSDRLARFRREAELLAALNHPHIAQIYGLEQAEGQMAIVMELVEGPTLAERIASGPIPPDEAVSIALQVLAALEAAHEKLIVHRDLKPANIKLRPDGTVKVLDFGISKPVDPRVISGGSPVLTTPAMTQTGIILGTAAYMSPEQARGRLVDQRTDIWAFGCLLFEMLTGQPAFGGEDIMLTLARVLDRDTDLSSIPKSISPAVRHTIRLCLEKDPRQRIADVRDVRLALEGRFESVSPAVAGPERNSSRGMLAPGVSLALGMALAALTALALWPEPPAPQVSRWIHRVPPELAPTMFGDAPVLAISRDGTEFAYTSAAGIVRRLLRELESRVIPGTAASLPIAPAYSADDRSLVYGSGNLGPLLRVGLEGDSRVELTSSFPRSGWGLGADGDWYGATTQNTCVVMRIPSTGGAGEIVFENTDRVCAAPSLLPGGRHLLAQTVAATSSLTGPWSVSVLSLETQEVQLLFPGQLPTVVGSRYLVFYEPTLGLSARLFDLTSFEFGEQVSLIDDILPNVQGSVAHFRVSPGGTLVYLRRDTIANDMARTALLHPDGRIEPLALTGGDIRFPAYSPDGNWLVLQHNGPDASGIGPQLWLHDLTQGTEPRQLTFDGMNALASWSADGEWLTFVSDRGGSSRVWRQRADGRGTAEVLTERMPGDQHLFPVWAPDGRLVYSVLGSANPTLDAYIVAVPDGEPELLLGGDGNQLGIAFAPDKQSIAYESDGTIFVEPFPRDGGTRRQVSRTGETASWPVWSSDGTRLAYRSGSLEIHIVDIDTTNFAIRNRRAVEVPLRPVASDRIMDAVPGSDGWLVILANDSAGGAGTAAEIVVVEGWLAELDARVPQL